MTRCLSNAGGLLSRAAAILLGLFGLSAVASGQIQIGADEAATLVLPDTTGDGVYIDVHNLIGGGRAPLPSDVDARTPTGSTLSPFVDFPRPGSTINVGQSFTTFFASTTTPPEVLRTAAARNFILDIRALVRVEQQFDRNPATPEINLSLRIGSDDGFYLVVGDTYVGQTGDRGFGWSAYDFAFESPGLYPVRLLFAANAVGFSGLEFQWYTALTGNWALIPQEALYLADTGCVDEFDFEGLDLGTSPADQYLDRGVRFEVVSGGPVVTDARPLEFIPVSGDRVIGDPDPLSTDPGELRVSFWASDGEGGLVPGETDEVGLFVINANTRDGGAGARVTATGAEQQALFDQVYVGGVGAQEPVTIVAPGILGLALELGQGQSAAAIDNLCVGLIRPAPADLAGGTPSQAGGTAVFGQALDTQWTVTNLGGVGSGGGWTHSVYLSLDGMLDASDRLLATAIPGPDLGYSDEQTVNASPILPLALDLPAGDYRLLVVLDSDNAVQEIAESNNTLVSDPIAIARPALPDLKPDGISAATSGSFPGGEIDVTWTVRNIGAAPATGTWTDRVYLSLDTTIDGDDVLLSPDTSVSGPIAAETGIYQKRAVFSLPAIPVGSYFVIVDVNHDDAARELENRQNNAAVSVVPFRIDPPPLPDLQVTTLTPPPNLPPGSNVTLTWTVRNNGPGPVSGTWTERVFGSLDATLGNGNDQEVGSFTFSDSLAPGQSVQRTRSVTVPQVPPGGYWAIVEVDSGRVIAEANEANNVLAAQVCVNCQTPDLDVVNVQGPSAGVAGSAAEVTWTTRNIGAGAASGAWTDRVYLSSDAQAGGDTFLGEIRWTGGLAAGAPYTRSLSVVIPPETEGPVWFVVVTDANNELSEPGGETNNAEVAATETAVDLPSLPDLSVASAQVETPTPVFGGPLALSWTVRNIGPVTAAGLWIDRAFLSRDELLDTGDVPLSPTRPAPVGSLPPQGSYGGNAEMALPLSAALDDGQYFVLIQADGGALIAEQRESNNLLAVGPISIVRPPLPDLEVASISTPSGGNPGDQVEIVWTTTNTGGESADLPWRERLLLVLANGTEVLAANLDADAPLASGEASSPRSASVTVPSQGNTFRVRVLVDPVNQVLESGEDNNALTSGEAPVFRPDVLVADIVADPSATAGETLEVSWRVSNVGLGDTSTYFLDRVTLESGGVSHFLGIFPHNAPIPAGQSEPVSMSFPLPDRIEGEFLVRVVTDSTDRLIETGPTTNNTGVSTGTVLVSQPPRADLVVEAITPPSDGLVGSTGSVSWRVRNASTETAAGGPWIDRVTARPVGATQGEAIQLALVTRSADLPPGQDYEQSVEVRLPGFAGSYEIEVTTDNGDQVNEGLSGGENNNILRDGAFEARTYTVSAFASVETALSGAAVSVSGQALAPGGEAIPQVPVSVRLRVQGTTRTLAAATDAAGFYTVPLPLSPTEAGVYSIFAGATPEETAALGVPNDTFTLHGISMNALVQGPVVTVDSSAMASLEVRNSGDAPLSSLDLTLVDGPDGVSFYADAGDGLAPRERRQVPYELFVDPGVSPGIYRLQIAAMTAEGAASITEIEFQVRAAQARLAATPGVLRTGMLRSLPDEPRLTTVEFAVMNTGAAPTGPVEVELPSTSWLSLASPSLIPGLAPGDSAGVVLNLLPGSTLPLGVYSGNLVLDPESGQSLSVPYEFNLVSDGVGDLEVLVEDELTYYGNGANGTPDGPLVAGASVTLLNPRTGAVVATTMTDSSGRAALNGLPEGAYDLVVSEPNHRSERVVVEIFRGQQSSARLFLYRAMVRYTWDVDPVAIDDTYRIVLNAEFETFVPFPVLEVSPGYVDLTQYVGQTVQIDFDITNRGLVAAEQVEIGVGTDGRWRVTPLISDIGIIQAGETVTIPVIFEDTFVFGRGGGTEGGADPGDPCYFRVSMSVAHRKYCGPVLRTYTVGVQFRLPDVFCPGGFDPPPIFTWSGDGDDDDTPPSNQGPNNRADAPPCGCYEVAVVFFTGSPELSNVNTAFNSKADELNARYPGRVAARTFSSWPCPTTPRDNAANWVRSRNADDCPCGDPKVILVGHSLGGDTAHWAQANPAGMDVGYTLLIDPINRDSFGCLLCVDGLSLPSECEGNLPDNGDQRSCTFPGGADEVHLAQHGTPVENQAWGLCEVGNLLGYRVDGASEVYVPGSNHGNIGGPNMPWSDSVDVQVERLLQAGCGSGG
jgi:subtilase family serine protease